MYICICIFTVHSKPIIPQQIPNLYIHLLVDMGKIHGEPRPFVQLQLGLRFVLRSLQQFGLLAGAESLHSLWLVRGEPFG